MVAANKQRTLTKLISLLGKNYDVDLPKEFSVLDHLLLAVIQEDMSFSKALEAHRSLLTTFHDLNELRVSHVEEVVGALSADVPDRPNKARRLLQILQFVFETTYSYDLEQMRKKPLKQAQKQISKIQGTNPFIIGAVVQRGLGGHALSVDESMLKLLCQLELLEAETPPEQTASALEHLVPKAKGLAFMLQLSELAAESPRKQKTLLKDLLPSGTGKGKSSKAPPKRPAEKKSVKKKAADG